MTYKDILYEVAEEVATLTLNRPDKLNAWTMQMGLEVEHALSMASDDPGVRVIVITGAGKGFCAGADLGLLSDISLPAGGPADAAKENEPMRWPIPFNLQLPTLRKPVLAAINGHAVGMGFALALCCDLRYASTTAKLSTVFSKLGLVAEYGLAWTLPRLVGTAKAFELLYFSKMMDAEESKAIGLVDAVFEASSFLKEVQQRAKELATIAAPRSLTIIRRQVYEGASQTSAEAAAIADAEMRASLQTADFKEGLGALLEKRSARFPSYG